MLDRVTIRVSDLEESLRFYRTVLGREPERGEFPQWDEFSIAPAEPDRPVTQNLHIAFAATSRQEVDAFWRRGVDAGYRSDGDPGPRPEYAADYYGAFLLDPDGNSVEAVHGSPRTETGPRVDHLWLGVADLEASRGFWEAVAPVLGLQVEDARLPGLVVVAGQRRHLMLVPGRAPTENVHLSFPVADDEAVAVFYDRAGSPGPCVRDPDGNSVAVVSRFR